MAYERGDMVQAEDGSLLVVEDVFDLGGTIYVATATIVEAEYQEPPSEDGRWATVWRYVVEDDSLEAIEDENELMTAWDEWQRLISLRDE